MPRILVVGSVNVDFTITVIAGAGRDGEQHESGAHPTLAESLNNLFMAMDAQGLHEEK